MSQGKTFWRITLEGVDGYAMFTDDLNDLANEIGVEPGPYLVFINRVDMTQAEYDALPEFEGF